MHTVAADLNITLDPPLSCVDARPDGSVYITASPSTFPRTNDERLITQSALHSALLEEFKEVKNLHVQVIVPEALSTPDGDMTPATTWIQGQHKGVNEMARSATFTMIRSAYMRAVEAYPWRDHDAMKLRVSQMLVLATASMETGGIDPVVSFANVDAILPSPHQYITAAELDIVRNDVELFLGRVPTTLLELYESIYFTTVAFPSIVCGPTRTLAYSVFEC